MTDQALTVRGFVRSHRLRWDDIATIADGSSGNVTGEGRCVVIRLENGRLIRARGCSSYSRAKIERMARAIAAARPARERPP